MSQNGYRRPKNEAEKLERHLARYPVAVRLVDEGKARPQVVEAVQCVRDGLTWKQATRKLGIARSTYYQRLNDPTDEATKARKARHHGTCEDCGAPTFNSGSPDTPRRCLTCERTRNRERNERIIELWEKGWTAPQIGEELGLTATAVASWVDMARRRQGLPIAAHRLRDREAWPVVAKRWNAGASAADIAMEVGTTPESVWVMVQNMRAAGYDLKRRGRRDEEYAAEFVTLWNEGLTLAELGAHFGISRSGAGSMAHLLRKRGYDVPSRRKVAA